MNSLASLNSWLNDNNIYSGDYDYSTYIAGDFTASLDHAINLSKNYKKEQYDVLNRNCMQTTWECLLKGKFYDGTTVGSSVKADIGIRPNSNYESIADIFYNNKFTHEKYWKEINDKLWQERENVKNAWFDWSKNKYKKRVKMLEKLYY